MPRIVSSPPEVLTSAQYFDAPRRFPEFAWIVLAYTVALILEGAFVRATGSGAGCGNHWPLCGGQLVFGTPALATVIEFAHRSMTVIDTVLILWIVVWAFRAFPKHHGVRLAAALSTLFLLTEALIGAALVKYGLVVNDASPARAAVLSLHQTNTLTLLACLTLTAWWAGHARFRPSGRTAWMAWGSLSAVAVLCTRLPPDSRKTSAPTPTSPFACARCIRSWPPPWRSGSYTMPYGALRTRASPRLP
jgi:heme A synthase